ncbi:MAG: hypothetical protein ACYSWO_19780 [Planctomycetota bacterium]|jgi:hypothetical protein
MKVYEYNTKKGKLGSLPPRATARNLPPGMGWTGGFTIPNNPQRFSMQTCSGSAAVPMDSSSDLICGRSAEVSHLSNIGCVPVGFQGSHHCLTDDNNQGIFHCCPPGVLDQEMARAGSVVQANNAIPAGLLLGVGAFAVVLMGVALHENRKNKLEQELVSF